MRKYAINKLGLEDFKISMIKELSARLGWKVYDEDENNKIDATLNITVPFFDQELFYYIFGSLVDFRTIE